MPRTFRRQLKLERFLPKAFSSESLPRTRSGVGTGSRAENASKKGSTLDLFRFVPFRLNRLAAEVSAALSSEYQQRYGLDIPEWRGVVARRGRHEAVRARESTTGT